MRTISLKAAFEVLQSCSAVIVAEDNVVTLPNLADLESSDENEFLYLSWTNEDGLDFYTKFREGENQQVEVWKSSMYLMDSEGDRVELTILEPVDQISE